MRKFLFGTMAVLCTLLMSCSKQELNFDPPGVEKIESRSVAEVTVSYLDSKGVSQTITCKKVSLTYLTSTSIRLVSTFSNGSSHTTTGNNVTVLPVNQRLKVTPSSNSSFLASDFYVQSCGSECCYTFNNGNNIGTGASFIVEDEAAGF